jgi:hypothetical protein
MSGGRFGTRRIGLADGGVCERIPPWLRMPLPASCSAPWVPPRSSRIVPAKRPNCGTPTACQTQAGTLLPRAGMDSQALSALLYRAGAGRAVRLLLCVLAIGAVSGGRAADSPPPASPAHSIRSAPSPWLSSASRAARTGEPPPGLPADSAVSAPLSGDSRSLVGSQESAASPTPWASQAQASPQGSLQGQTASPSRLPPSAASPAQEPWSAPPPTARSEVAPPPSSWSDPLSAAPQTGLPSQPSGAQVPGGRQRFASPAGPSASERFRFPERTWGGQGPGFPPSADPRRWPGTGAGQQDLSGTWRGSGGDLVIIQGNHARLYGNDERIHCDCVFWIYGDRLISYSPQTDVTHTYVFERRGNRFALQDETGQIMIYERVSGPGW